MGRDQLSDRMADVGAPLGNVDSASIHRTLWKDAQDVVYRAEAVYNLLMRMETAQAINRLGWQSVRNCFMGVLRGTVKVTAAEERLDVKAHTMGLAEALQRASAEDSKVAVTGSPIRHASPTDASDAASEPLTLWLTIDLLDEGWVEFRNPTDKSAQMVGMNRQTWQALGCPARIQAVVTEQPQEGTR